jgi:Uma2 family endonuclease
MASTTLLTAEQYLESYGSAKHAPELVRGELVHRSMPKWIHARLQGMLYARLETAGMAATELHLRLADDVIRIADVAMYLQEPDEELPSKPPLVVVEIVSPDDRLEDVIERLKDYRAWGVEHIWLVEPRWKEFYIFDSRGLTEVKAFELPNLRIEAADLFAQITAR